MDPPGTDTSTLNHCIKLYTELGEVTHNLVNYTRLSTVTALTKWSSLLADLSKGIETRTDLSTSSHVLHSLFISSQEQLELHEPPPGLDYLAVF